MADWQSLEQELRLWARQHRRPTLWWRDDDAEADVPELQHLLQISDELQVPVLLAAVPAKVQPSLATAVQGHGLVGIVQHGFDHTNHAPPTERKHELGAHRPLAVMIDALRQGRELLEQHFAGRFQPVLVPPWNRYTPALRPYLHDQVGLRGLSTLGPRDAAEVDGLTQVNVHVDVLKWKPSAHFAGEADTLTALITHLQQRRLGLVDAAEPTGIMTHHLVMDAAAWRFTRQLLKVLNDAGVGWIADLLPAG
ncbi:hypothetical protein WH50_19685 [Pokkaliibacter plantistimulans]|uniref:Polysaccharide deacetylase n=1 Tax=Pokkaliibacter plantistimulans TaxID=1635171 RepID=A0ABX5LSJ8_9GAMM|nr:polysaccharide deacetylase family protein [Pokkaliibacter plantistimulans]PXF29636.1 hypothetical protein WH50_19685 [Pokkaliibacter plantistimulans]